jgi:hypothetical protein
MKDTEDNLWHKLTAIKQSLAKLSFFDYTQSELPVKTKLYFGFVMKIHEIIEKRIQSLPNSV